jgi:hypothetical protein
MMTDTFKVGDHVSWNSEVGRVSGTIIRVHTRDIDVKGYTHHASSAQRFVPQQLITHGIFTNGTNLTQNQRFEFA